LSGGADDSALSQQTIFAVRSNDLFLAVNLEQKSLVDSTEKPSMHDTSLAFPEPIPIVMQLSRDAGYLRAISQQLNETNGGHISSPQPYSKQLGTIHREPLFGLGNGATKWQITRSAKSLRDPNTQGGAHTRFTRVRLPWATILNAFSVGKN
jgi:hypothetical protein